MHVTTQAIVSTNPECKAAISKLQDYIISRKLMTDPAIAAELVQNAVAENTFEIVMSNLNDYINNADQFAQQLENKFEYFKNKNHLAHQNLFTAFCDKKWSYPHLENAVNVVHALTQNNVLIAKFDQFCTIHNDRILEVVEQFKEAYFTDVLASLKTNFHYTPKEADGVIAYVKNLVRYVLQRAQVAAISGDSSGTTSPAALSSTTSVSVEVQVIVEACIVLETIAHQATALKQHAKFSAPKDIHKSLLELINLVEGDRKRFNRHVELKKAEYRAEFDPNEILTRTGLFRCIEQNESGALTYIGRNPDKSPNCYRVNDYNKTIDDFYGKNRILNREAWNAYQKERDNLREVTNKFYEVNKKNYSSYTRSIKTFFGATCGTDSTVKPALSVEPNSGAAGMQK